MDTAPPDGRTNGLTVDEMLALPDLPERADLLAGRHGGHGPGPHPVAEVYELDRTGTYVLTGLHHNRLTVEVPYPIDIDPTAVDRR